MTENQITSNAASRLLAVLRDPAASYELKRSVRGALDRDPVDAANDAEALAELLKARAAEAAYGFTGNL